MHVLCAVVLCVVLAAMPLLSGCDADDAETKTHVSVSVWDESVLTSGFAAYIDAQNPDYDIEWIVGQDSLDFYEYQAENGSLPDVMLIKDFNEADASSLSDSLYDLSGSDLAESYNGDYLAGIQQNGDKVTYLPAAGGFEGILINDYLFESYGIPVPTDRDSFVSACAAFAEQGHRGFVAGLGDAETCYEVIQGFAEQQLVTEAQDFFTSVLQVGSSSVSVDSAAFDDAMTFVDTLVSQQIIQASDLSLSNDAAEQMFVDGEAAMLFISDGQASTFGSEHNMTVRAIPFFGESDSWAFVEPAFIGAVSDVQSEGVKNTASNETLHKAAVEVLSSIMSQESQQQYFDLTGMDLMIPSQSDAGVNVPNALSTLTPCVEAGDVRLYLPEREIANAVGSTLQEVAAGTVSGEDAGSEVGSLIKESEASSTEEVVVTFSEGVSNTFDDSEGNVAASDIAQTVATQLDADFGMVSSYAARCPLYSGDKTQRDLKYPVAEYPLYTADLTGAQIEELISAAVSSANTRYDLPVVSGLHIVVDKTDDGYSLASVERILATGEAAQGTGSSEGRLVTEALDGSKTYSIAFSCSRTDAMASYVDQFGFTACDEGLQETWLAAFEDVTLSNIPAYQDYFEFSE